MNNNSIELSEFTKRTIFISLLITIVLLLGFNILNLRHQVSVLDSNYSQKISKVIKFNENDLLNEIILNQNESLRNHLNYLVEDLDVDSIQLQNTQTQNTLTIMNNRYGEVLSILITKLVGTYSYQYKLLNINNESFGILRVNYTTSLIINSISKLVITFAINLLLVVLGYSLLFLFFNRRIHKNIIEPITSLSSNIKNVSQLEKLSFSIKEIESLRNSLIEDSKIKEKYSQLEIKSKKFELTRQITHDIASPIATLKLLISHVQFKDEKSRSLYLSSLERLTNISFEVLEHDKRTSLVKDLEAFFNEKKFEHQDKNIEFVIRNNGIQDHIKISLDVFKLKSILSNVINNSVEALESRKNPMITLTLDSNENNVIIHIQDNGSGIPAPILKTLTTQEITTKESGNGIALLNAKKVLDTVTGSIYIESKLNIGTTICIKIPHNMPLLYKNDFRSSLSP